MLKKWAYSTCFLSGIASTSLYSQSACFEGPLPYRVTGRHIEAKGIGYDQGYTSLDLFLSPSDPYFCNWIPFLDLRGHIFDNGDPAANAGVGMRYIEGNSVFGANVYYDYRQNKHRHNSQHEKTRVYNQVGVGLEYLGECFDVRVNGYLPVARRKSSTYDFGFGYFSNNYLYLREKHDVAMRGVNGELGYHVPVKNPSQIDLYLAAGPYYLQGQGKATYGGEGRVVLDLWRYLRLEGSASYDNTFKWIGQGQLGINIPFGPRGTITPTPCNDYCKEYVVRYRATQRVDRNEIIALQKKTTYSTAIDPLTDQPYYFLFVNNLSHSNGTFESPFNTLLAAQNASTPYDIIYVYPGDGTTTGLDGGITLLDYQKLFGSGIAQTLLTTDGLITIPAMSLGAPQITNSYPNNIITCGNNNEISGITTIGSAGSGNQDAIVATGINNLFIHDNTINYQNKGIATNVCTGQITIQNNRLDDASADFYPWGIYLDSSGLGENYLIQNNSLLSSSSTSTGVYFEGRDVSPNYSVIILNNYFHNDTNSAIAGIASGPGIITIANNVFDHCGANIYEHSIVDIEINPDPLLNINVQNNRWLNSQITSVHSSLYINNVYAASNVCVTFSGNKSDTNPAYVFDNSNSGIFTLSDLGNNFGPVTTYGTITDGPCTQ